MIPGLVKSFSITHSHSCYDLIGVGRVEGWSPL